MRVFLHGLEDPRQAHELRGQLERGDAGHEVAGGEGLPRDFGGFAGPGQDVGRHRMRQRISNGPSATIQRKIHAPGDRRVFHLTPNIQQRQPCQYVTITSFAPTFAGHHTHFSTVLPHRTHRRRWRRDPSNLSRHIVQRCDHGQHVWARGEYDSRVASSARRRRSRMSSRSVTLARPVSR